METSGEIRREVARARSVQRLAMKTTRENKDQGG